MPPSRMLALSTFFPLCLAALAGCKTTVQQQGNRGVNASYSLMTLSSDLPGPTRVPAVIAAAEQVVRARGYTVDTSEATDESGRLVARPPRTTDAYPRLVVSAHSLAQGAHVEINYQPMGDQELSRSVLDGILQKLGM